MKDKIYNKINNENKKIIDELIDIIDVEEINSLEELKNYQEKLFRINGEDISDEEKVEYCIKLINNSPYVVENLNFLETRDLINMKRRLRDNKCSDVEKKILIIKIFSLVDFYMRLPYDAYQLILEGKI